MIKKEGPHVPATALLCRLHRVPNGRRFVLQKTGVAAAAPEDTMKLSDAVMTPGYVRHFLPLHRAE